MENINNNDYDNNFDYRETLMDRIKVNKRANINNHAIKNYNKINNNSNSKDNLYYSIEKRNKNPKNKIPKNKIPSSLIKNYKKSNNENKINNLKKFSTRDNIKKTINTYSKDNQVKEGNIFEVLQNNKYLRPMLGTSNINNKLLKCQIAEPIKNICTLSLKNYFAHNIDIPLQNYQSPKKKKFENNDISSEEKINIYNLNNRTAMERFNINFRNGFSPSNEILYYGDNNSNSFAYSGDSFALNNCLVRYSANNIKKRSINQKARIKKEKYFYSEERKEKDDSYSNLRFSKISNKNSIMSGSPTNTLLKNINKNSNKNKNINNISIKKKINLKKKNKNIRDEKDHLKSNNLLLIYKSKLVEEFIIVLNKFFSKYLFKKKKSFLDKIINYNSKSKSRSKIYFKKKNNRFQKKKLTSIDYKTIDDNFKKYLFSIDKEKEKQKLNAKVTTDTSTNFNVGNKSFSNEIKNSPLSNNFILNNIKINNQSSSFLFCEQKNKNYSQSPDDSINKKIPQTQIRTKTIVYQKQLSGSPNKNMSKSPSSNDRRESVGGYGGDTFVYRKKNLNSENTYINKINNLDTKSYYSQSKRYNRIINNNKTGKIIDIDINLGKPVNIINDHSPFDELLLERKKPMIFKLNTISSKIMNKNKKKNKARSGSKTKIKPPLRLKRFAEEDDDENYDEFIHNYYFDNNRAYSSLKNYKENNFENKYLYNNLGELFINSNNKGFLKSKYDNREKIIKVDKLCIRNNYFSFFNDKNKPFNKDKFKNLAVQKKISLLINDKKRTKKYKIKKESIKIINSERKSKKKVSKLYINCTKFLVKLLDRIIKKKIFIKLYRIKKYKKRK